MLGDCLILWRIDGQTENFAIIQLTAGKFKNCTEYYLEFKISNFITNNSELFKQKMNTRSF